MLDNAVRDVSSIWLVAAFTFAFVISAVLVRLTVRICTAHRWTAKPRGDRWHKGTPCLFGGVPLVSAFIICAFLFVPFHSGTVWKVIAAASTMALLGLVDDIWVLKPRLKLAGQFAAATLVLLPGLISPPSWQSVAYLVLAVVWIAGMTNAFNLLDNMDGLSTGIALISAIYLAMFYWRAGVVHLTVALIVFAGSLAGFLLFNFKPARIFMGDTGSLFIGFLLASISVTGGSHLSGISAFVFVPVLVLVIPLFDTFFVSITRRMRGQPISQGGTDHTSHVLVSLGLEEQNAVLFLYCISAVSGAVALLLRRVDSASACGIVSAWLLMLLVFGIHLSRPSTPRIVSEPVSRWKRLLTRDALVLLIDPAALSLAYYFSHLVQLSANGAETVSVFLKSLPVVLGAKFLCLAAWGIYRRSWWRGVRADIYRLLQAVIVGELVGAAALIFVYGSMEYSRLVFLLDAIFSWAILAFLRISFATFHDLLNIFGPRAVSGRRVLLIGTSEAAHTALRVMTRHGIYCVGLIDPNGGVNLPRLVWGVKVVGGLHQLGEVAQRLGANEVVLPDDEEVPIAESVITDLCRESKLILTRVGLYRTAINWQQTGDKEEFAEGGMHNRP